MAKKKNIAGIVYFPRKQHPNCNCSKCKVFIDSSTVAYLVGHLNSDEMMCGSCVNALFMENQIAKDKGAEPYDVNIPLYVGIRHGCNKQIYENIPFYFINEEKSKKINVKKCPKCGMYFVDEEVYHQNSFYFDKYQLINSQTKKEMVKFNTATKYLHPTQKIETEVPNHLQWAAKHPYQGGGFSGK